MKWAVKLPFADDYLFVVEIIDGYDQASPFLFDTREEAIKFAEAYKTYEVVEYEP